MDEDEIMAKADAFIDEAELWWDRLEPEEKLIIYFSNSDKFKNHSQGSREESKKS